MMDTMEKMVRLDVDVSPNELSYAALRGDLRLVVEIEVSNETDFPLRASKLVISSSSPLLAAVALKIPVPAVPDVSSASNTYKAKRSFKLDPSLLRDIPSPLSLPLVVSLVDDEGHTFATRSRSISVHPSTWWNGDPKVLSVFIQPHHSLVKQMVGPIGEPSDPVAAVYSLLSGYRLLDAPAHEERGEAIRPLGDIVSSKSGTPLELSLLFASIAEGMGLHPIVCLSPAIIFPGVVLDEKRSFDCVVHDDPSDITQDAGKHIVVVALGENQPFATACESALQKARQAESLLIVDVKFARLVGLHPLPERVVSPTGEVSFVEDAFFETAAYRPRLKDTMEEVDLAGQKVADNTPKGRIEQWQRRLLDFSYRNPLMNMRSGYSIVQILCPDMSSFVSALSKGTSFVVRPDFDALSASPDFSEAAVESKRGNPAFLELLSKKQVVVSENASTLTLKLGSIYWRTQKNLSESGVYTLYLTLGHIEYYDGEQMFRAPILLYPVELSRQNGTYQIKLRDDEDPQLNFSVFEKFRMEYGYETHLDYSHLPLQGENINVQHVFATLRSELSQIPRWKLVESVSVGIYSFDQFVMYNELKEHSAALMKNKVVKSLVKKKLCFKQEPLPEVKDSDFIDQVVPMECDESQLRAVKAAVCGYSFILQGPPGTGKSQTITSIIVNAMVQGKKVLFVAEKMAALQVVYRNLHQVGISNHLLELHSIKASKAHFLDQISAALEQSGETVARNAANEEQIKRISGELKKYVRELHKTRPCGMSLYQLINLYEAHREVPVTQLRYSLIKKVGKKELDACATKLGEISLNLARFRPLEKSPFQGLGITSYGDDVREQVSSLAGKLVSHLSHIALLEAEIQKEMPDGCKWNCTTTTGEKVKGVIDALSRLKEQEIEPGILAMDRSALGDGLEVLKRYSNLKLASGVSSDWSPEIFHESIPGLVQQWDGCKSGFFKGKERKRLLSKVNSMAPSGLVITQDNIVDELKKLNSFVARSARLKREEAKIPEEFRFLVGRDYEAAEHVVDLVAAYRKEVATLLEAMKCKHTEPFVLSVASAWYGDEHLIRTLDEFSKVQKSIASGWKELSQVVEADASLSDLSYAELQTRLEAWIQRTVDMEGWAHCNSLLSWFDTKPYADPFVRMMIGGMEAKEVALLLQASFEKSYIDEIFQQCAPLFQYAQAGFDENIRTLMQAQEEYRAYVKSALPGMLDARVPSDDRVRHVLSRFVATKGKKQSVREFLSGGIDAVLAYFPCFLMSPMSVAQFLDPERQPFDLVVFDEASQIPTCQAIGPIARGKDLIVVGDAKQMPPTSFFQKTATSDDEERDPFDGDLDSILADCNDIGLPQTSLNWHYRSTNESLIAFSNAHYYHRRLKTYPSVDSLHSRVSLRHVEGYYQSGSKEPNPAEADAIVMEIKRRLEDPVLCGDSIGVITFGEKQQALIQDKLEDLFSRKHNLAKLAKWDQSEIDCPDRLIVKNLENIQGDERDVILLSVTYGKNKAGRFSTNFGPISSIGGENRLNVAFSRAKKEMVVFTIIDLADFAGKQIPSKGGNDLRSFLQFASQAGVDEGVRSKREQSLMAQEILEMLREHGYEGALNVGLSDFQVDIALSHPKDPGTFFCGILLDGSGMLLSSLTNDRFILREQVLKARGWNVILVRTIDWFNDREKETRYILSLVGKYRSLLKKSEAVAAIPAEEEKPHEESSTFRIGIDYQGFEFNETDTMSVAEVKHLKPEQFVARFRSVIEGEGPIAEELLELKVLRSFGPKKKSPSLKPVLDEHLRSAGFITTEELDGEGNRQFVYWPEKWRGTEDIESAYTQYRRNGEQEGEKRQVGDIPRIEMLNAMYAVLQSKGTLMKEDLLKETSLALGFKGRSASVQKALESTIEQGLASARLAVMDEFGRIGIGQAQM